MFTLKIDTDTDAFHCDDGTEDSAAREEIARILRKLADALLADDDSFAHSETLQDRYGNDVGRATLETQRDTPSRSAPRGWVLRLAESAGLGTVWRAKSSMRQQLTGYASDAMTFKTAAGADRFLRTLGEDAAGLYVVEPRA